MKILTKYFYFIKKNLANLKYKFLSNEKKWFLIIGMLIGVFIIQACIFGAHEKWISSSNYTDIKHNHLILQKLNEMIDVLTLIKTNPNATIEQQRRLVNMEKELFVLHESLLKAVKLSDLEGVTKQLSTMKEDLLSQVSDLKKMISTNSKEYLDANILPFRVISVDVINGQPYASIDYSNHIQPLMVEDRLAGWKIVGLDYELGTAEFVNNKNQYIKTVSTGI